MASNDHVEVFNFHFIENPVESPRVANFKATRETIEALGGELLPGTHQAVAADELDELGRYRRVNSGWVALD
jgi:hypothetical protein